MAPHAEEPRQTAVTDTSSVTIPDPILTKTPTRSSIPEPVNKKWSISDILPHRETCQPMSKGVAAFGSADMFKSPLNAKKPLGKDWTPQLTAESAARKASSLKGAMKYFHPEMISLCGGLPSSDYFPFESMSVTVPGQDNDNIYGFSEAETRKTGTEVRAGKHDVTKGVSDYDLSIALNYGQSMGPPQIMRFVTEHTELVHAPMYRNWDICVTIGSTSALEIALRMFCTRGDFLLTEEYSFSSAIETALPMGVQPVGIKMDENGLLPDHLDEVLSNWDSTKRGGKKPFVLYTIPTGQNPTGYTQPLERRKAIYKVCEKHDLLILEDEPYYFLQMEPYISGKIHEIPSPFKPMPTEQFLSSLVPSYLSLDTTGRVIRMDSFSKIIAPGSRTGFVTAPAQIIERFIRHQEVSSQNPSGFAMVALYKLLEETWGHEGFLGWLGYIRAEYTRRRDVMINACEEFLPTSVASWVAPAAGMFHWIVIDGSKHPSLSSSSSPFSSPSSSSIDKTTLKSDLEDKIFLSAVQNNVLVAKGSWFRAEKETLRFQDSLPRDVDVIDSESGSTGTDTDLAFRMTFAAASEDQIITAVRRFGDALKMEFGV